MVGSGQCLRLFFSRQLSPLLVSMIVFYSVLVLFKNMDKLALNCILFMIYHYNARSLSFCQSKNISWCYYVVDFPRWAIVPRHSLLRSLDLANLTSSHWISNTIFLFYFHLQNDQFHYGYYLTWSTDPSGLWGLMMTTHRTCFPAARAFAKAKPKSWRGSNCQSLTEDRGTSSTNWLSLY